MSIPLVVPGSILPAAPYCVPPSATPDERAAIIAARAREAIEDPYVREIAAGIRCANCNDAERAAAVLRRAQAAGFVADPPACDAYRPVATTLRHGGDCDDLTPLVMALGELSGFRARVAYLSQPDMPQDHVTGMLYVDGDWRWAEPSIRGARLGEHPYEAARRLGYHAPFGTGQIGAVIDGVFANLLTLGIVAGVTYFAARAGAKSARRNPFAGYRDFAACERSAKGRGVRDTGAYCGAIKRRMGKTRRNPTPAGVQEDTYLVKDLGVDRLKRTGIVWMDRGNAYRLDLFGSDVEFTWGPLDTSGQWKSDDPPSVSWSGSVDAPLSADDLRKLGMANYAVFEEMRARYAELRPSDFTER